MPRARTLALAALLAVGVVPAAGAVGLALPPAPPVAEPAQYYVAPQVNDWQNYSNGRQVNPYRGQVSGAPVVVAPRARPPAYGYGYGYDGGVNQPPITVIVPDTRSFDDKYGFSSKPR